MGNIILYLIFILIGLCTGVVFWIIRKYYLLAVTAFIFSMFAPFFTLLVSAQRDTGIGIYAHMKDEVSAGNSLARFLVVMHVYLIIWLLFLLVRGIIYLTQSPAFKKKLQNIINKLSPSTEQKE